MWFILSLVAIVFWGGSDLFSKMGSDPNDKLSHFKIVIAVGAVMGIHATVELLTGAEFYPADFIRYFPATFFYITSMIIGYVGLRYIMLSVSSPICNSSGAVACILCLIFLRQMPDLLSWAGIILVCAGITGLAFVEKKYDTEAAELLRHEENKKYKSGFIAVFFPIFYCLLDGMGTFVDAILLDRGIVNEDSANIAYEYSFLILGVICAVYIYGIKKQKLSLKWDTPKLLGACCETAGQFAYIYAIGSNPTVAAPMISSYCVFSVLLSRIFLKEKLKAKHYLVICTVFLGIILMGISEGLAE